MIVSWGIIDLGWPVGEVVHSVNHFSLVMDDPVLVGNQVLKEHIVEGTGHGWLLDLSSRLSLWDG